MPQFRVRHTTTEFDELNVMDLFMFQSCRDQVVALIARDKAIIVIIICSIGKANSIVARPGA